MANVKKLIGSLILVATIIHSPLAFAAEEQSQIESENQVSVISGESQGSPLDPLNPEPNRPIEPVNPLPGTPETGTGGNLSIDFASNFQFGQHPVSTKETEFFADPQYLVGGEARPNFIQITDVRGTGTGWQLTAIQSPFETETKTILRGSVLSFENLSVLSERVSENGPTLSAPRIEFVPGEETAIASAGASQGMGTWIIRMGQSEAEAANSVKVDVLNETVRLKNLYTTKIQWVLKDTP
ncbi:hypothetical protein BAU15_00325 [Enterococcus sp. JM4C]|uniref:WxL domain-containing protein n=1 Tax=Candidatus Enterococcus huntleyi TaxID=1857217 RepID=UPI00137A18FF|nr:WxL domain-containing protein [Enterococcus sp. JM4C]KAF1299125.1 hypothetical protein BAU15_00325 [Enterococcus sp. JM4C]